MSEATEEIKRKKFRDTKFYKFVTEKLPAAVGDTASIASKIVSGNWSEALEEVSNVIKGEKAVDPKVTQEFLIMQMDYMLELQRIDQEMYRIEVQDRESARNTEIQRLQSGGKSTTQNVLAFVAVISFIAIVAWMIIYGVKDMSSEASLLVGSLTGTIGTMAVSVMSYYFGSSRGSREKDANINELIRQR